MMTNFFKYSMILFAAVSFTLASNLVYAQEQISDSLKTTAVQARGDAPDENIVVEIGENIKGEGAEAPPFKSGDVSERANNRFTNFDNWTGLYIKTYINGYYQGTIAPWGNLRIHVPQGRTYRLYAKADFDDGSYVYWGGVDRYIGNSFEWELHTE